MWIHVQLGPGCGCGGVGRGWGWDEHRTQGRPKHQSRRRRSTNLKSFGTKPGVGTKAVPKHRNLTFSSRAYSSLCCFPPTPMVHTHPTARGVDNGLTQIAQGDAKYWRKVPPHPRTPTHTPRTRDVWAGAVQRHCHHDLLPLQLRERQQPGKKGGERRGSGAPQDCKTNQHIRLA